MNIVHGLVDVSRHLPSWPAVAGGGRSISYAELGDRVLRTAASLRREHGLDPVLEGSVVGRPHSDWGEEVVGVCRVSPRRRRRPAALGRICLERVDRFVGRLPKKVMARS